jgi:elongator complex protein 1
VGKVLLMSQTFETISEFVLETEDFGEGDLESMRSKHLLTTSLLDTQANVGWGSKSTQFHGSLGKAAAHSPNQNTASTLGPSSDDDLLPRISWRGDSAFFSISSISQSRRRTIRVYNSSAALQSTSEPVAGLEHSLSWKPEGTLIASTQRFGKGDGLARGRDGRHDVIFFERNGLRHGEFELRCDRWKRSAEKESNLRYGYRVKELAWNADSSVLAVWIELDDSDIGKALPRSHSCSNSSSVSSVVDDKQLPLVPQARSHLL